VVSEVCGDRVVEELAGRTALLDAGRQYGLDLLVSAAEKGFRPSQAGGIFPARSPGRSLHISSSVYSPRAAALV